MTRGTARNIDKDPGWVERRFREVWDMLDALSFGKLDNVPGSVVSIEQILTDPASPIRAWNRDTAVATADDTAVTIPLTYLPLPDSLIVRKGGLALETLEFAYDTGVVTVEPSADVIIREGQRFSTYYLYDSVAANNGITIPVPWASTGPILIVAEGDTTDYSSPSLDDSGWTYAPAPLGYPLVPPDTFWDIPVATSTAGTDLGFWIRRGFTLPAGGLYDISANIDGQHWLYLDGVLIHSYTGPSAGVDNHLTVPAQLLSAGNHIVALHINDDTPDGGADYIYGDVHVEASA